MTHLQRKINIKNFTIFFISFLFIILICSFFFTRIAYSLVELFIENRKTLVLKDEFIFVVLLVILNIILVMEKKKPFQLQKKLIFYSLVGVCCIFFFIGPYIFKFIPLYNMDTIINVLLLLQIILMVLAIKKLPISKPSETSSFIGLLVIAIVEFFITITIVICRKEIFYITQYLKNKTFHFIQPVLVIGAVSFILLLISIKLFGKLNIRRLELFHALSLINGIAIFFFIWILVQLTQFVVVYFLANKVVWVFSYDHIMPAEWLGNYFAYIFGVGLPEEFFMRGFMFIQLYSLFLSKFSLNKEWSIFISLMISQAYFSMSHLPKLLELGMAWDYLIQTFVLGIFFVLAYLRTSNLYVSIFIHGLIDYNDPLFYPKEIIPYTEDISYLVQFYALIALIFWPWITKNDSQNNKEL
ncbi:CPBP family intramembrane glutamic endopeptidase [Geobacillus sp. TFV-3]|uniref:CPBP family intramembrane glutamic endopeptidase n=1 Tax=Geobacillus sp. TFV-3 TaxID=1897059 RepID=UPI00135867EA|nr:CPBP family intramembrane glutamic endopeptidase [Geobacillus sp. TFV-3]KAF0995954.1 hypothetical protein BJQ97_02616 [Geobacillus sp. TFV-3]